LAEYTDGLISKVEVVLLGVSEEYGKQIASGKIDS